MRASIIHAVKKYRGEEADVPFKSFFGYGLERPIWEAVLGEGTIPYLVLIIEYNGVKNE